MRFEKSNFVCFLDFFGFASYSSSMASRIGAEFWLISAPGDKTPQHTWDKCKAKTEAQHLSQNWKFALPELKVGTLDTLVGLSDELGKLDILVESIVRKVAGYFMEVLEEKQENALENLKVNSMEPGTYLTKFQWDSAKYPTKQPLKNLTEIISKQITQIDSDLKSKATTYNNIKNNLQTLERKSTGSLLTRNLGTLVKREQFVHDSEYLQTLLVVVSKQHAGDWEVQYERLTDMVVPRSSTKVFEDTEHCLYTVTLFKKVIDEFKHHAREKKFMVRDFVWDDTEIAASKEELTKLAANKKKHFGPLVRWLRVNFGESFIAWTHVKALRLFVESVLRYGLPVNFQAMILEPGKGKNGRLRNALDELYRHLDNEKSGDKSDANMDIPGLMMGQQEYFSYVYFNIKLNILDR